MDKQELEALADAMLAQHRGENPAPKSVAPPTAPPAVPAKPPAAAAPEDLEKWADALLAQHRTAPSARQKDLPPLARMFSKFTSR